MQYNAHTCTHTHTHTHTQSVQKIANKTIITFQKQNEKRKKKSFSRKRIKKTTFLKPKFKTKILKLEDKNRNNKKQNLDIEVVKIQNILDTKTIIVGR